MSMSEKVVAITGAPVGSAATARRLVADGAKVAVLTWARRRNAAAANCPRTAPPRSG